MLTMRSLRNVSPLLALLGLLAGCVAGHNAGSQGDNQGDTGGDAQPAPKVDEQPSSSSALPTGRPCDVVPDGSAEVAEQAEAMVPLVTGLTLGWSWVGPDSGKNDFDHECLAQVTSIDSVRVVFHSRCTEPPPRQTPGRARTILCRADLRAGAIYRTEFGSSIPDLVAGSTMNLLSRAAFRRLRDQGDTPFRQVHLFASSWQRGAEAPDPDANVYVQEDVAGTLRRTGTGSVRVQLNDSSADVPVIHAEVELRAQGQERVQRERLTILDDERVPLVLDNERASTSARLRFTRITWPQRAALERKLASREDVTVYGIHFEYNSVAIRSESDSVLAEIGSVLGAHPEWSLSIEGHTDSIGGRAFNDTLSQRRAEAVRVALMERFGVAATRLTASGAGMSRPVETNATPEGRALNRRVELRRK